MHILICISCKLEYKKNLVIEHTTGHGKNPIIVGLAKAISNSQNAKN